MGDLEKYEEEKKQIIKEYLLLEVSWLNPEEVALKDFDLQIFIDDHTVTVEGEEGSIRIYSLYHKGLKVLSGYYDELGKANILSYVPGKWESFLGTCRHLQQKHEDDGSLELIWKK